MLPIYTDFIRHHILITALDDSQFNELQKVIHLHTYAPNDHLFAIGDKADRFYLLFSGQIKLYRVSVEGQEKVLEIIQPGGSFAEAIMFMDKQVYPANAQTLKPCEVISINAQLFRNLLESSPRSCFHMMADLSMRLHRRLNEIETLTLQNATYRVIRYLMALLPDHRDHQAIQLPASKRLIASQLAIQPETFSRILHRLKDEGIIEIEGRDISTNDYQLLVNYQ